jgi:tricorn protease
MWIGSTNYFVSDRDGTLNLYSYDITSQQVEELTHSTVWDVRWASSDNLSKVVYELDGELHVYDTKVRKDVKLDIDVPTTGSTAGRVGTRWRSSWRGLSCHQRARGPCSWRAATFHGAD